MGTTGIGSVRLKSISATVNTPLLIKLSCLGCLNMGNEVGFALLARRKLWLKVSDYNFYLFVF